MTVIGTCEAMCPQFEIIQREFERKIDKNEKVINFKFVYYIYSL
jgi:hypothetical protein